MSNYSGQPAYENGMGPANDTEFTERLRRKAERMINSNEFDPDTEEKLRILANQNPPSHQAQYYLGLLIATELGLPLRDQANSL